MGHAVAMPSTVLVIRDRRRLGLDAVRYAKFRTLIFFASVSPPTQRRLRECALRSKLWIELTKGRTDGSVLDLSFYKDPDVPVELSPEDLENLYALEWQAHLHAFGEDEIDTEKERRE